MKTAFVCDSGCGLSVKEMEAYGCFSVPLQISYDNVTKLEGEEISIEETWDLVESGKVLKTSLAPLGLIEELFERLKNEGYERIFATPICKGLSGTIDAMEMMAAQCGLAFDYYDCNVTAVVEAYMTIRSKQLYDEGKSLEEIKALLEKVNDSTNTLLIPNDLNALAKGGRLTPLAAKLGGLLKIKPILQINKKTAGRIDVLDKVRTMPKALSKTLDTMREEINGDGEGYNITVAHVKSEESGLSLLNMYKEAFPAAKFQLIKLVSVVGVHTGLGCLAVQYFKEY